ncbi:MAG: hypothetical protein EA416_13390 [Trueperaceae bacterium]|nr:MAG: hypothetical protein EA416_13390 [Trueperaceae bacterium]
MAGSSELTVADLGRVVFRELATDRTADAVRFEGGVCLEIAGERVTITADAIVVERLTTDPLVRAGGAVVIAEGWRFDAEELVADARSVRLHTATLVGEDFVALASELVLDLDAGTAWGRDLVAATPWARLDIREATLDADEVVGVGVVLSTCDCPPSEAAVRVEGEGVRVGIHDGVVVVEAGTLVAGAVRVPLGSRLEVDVADVEGLRSPLALVLDERRGWLLTLVERRQEEIRWSADLALEADAAPRWRMLVAGDDERGGLDVVLSASGVAVRTSAALPLGGAWSLRLEQRVAGGTAFGVQNASLALRHGVGRALTSVAPAGNATLFDVGIALSAERRGAAEVASPRAWASARWDTATRTGSLGTLRVRFEGGVTGAVTPALGQTWWGVTPRWDVRVGSLELSLMHAYRGVTGSTPFSDDVDRVDPRQLSTLAVRTGGAAPVRAAVDLRYDWRDDPTRSDRAIGLERARATVSAVVIDPPSDAGVRVSARGTVELSGVLDPRQGRDAFARFGVDATWPDAAPELALEATVGLVPGSVGLRDLTLAAGTPLRWEAHGVTLRPYLALDVWPSLRGDGWPALRGHGVALAWETAYGVVDAAYRSQPDGSATSSVGFRVPVRTPSLDDLRR